MFWSLNHCQSIQRSPRTPRLLRSSCGLCKVSMLSRRECHGCCSVPQPAKACQPKLIVYSVVFHEDRPRDSNAEHMFSPYGQDDANDGSEDGSKSSVEKDSQATGRFFISRDGGQGCG